MCPIRRLFLVVASCLISLSSAWAVPALELVNQVSSTTYTGFLNDALYTHTGDNRGISGAQHDLARTNIVNSFQTYNLQPVLDPFTYSGSTYYNVVGTIPGCLHPEQYYIVGAHYDSVNNPGADDNGSGTAGVLELARVFSQYAFESSVLFIAFDREEQGLVGSNAHPAAFHPLPMLNIGPTRFTIHAVM